jgi:CRISPR system Cascade subunit CasE
MTYVSQLVLNPQNAAAQRDLADCHALHCTILKAFPHSQNAGARERFKVLYRVENDSGDDGTLMLVQSECRPDWSELPPAYLAALNSEFENPACKSLDSAYDRLRSGLILQFRLRANPTRKICTKSGPHGEKRNGKRVRLRTDDELLSWLKHKGDVGGFELVNVRSNPDVPNTRIALEAQSRGKRSATGTLTFDAVLFEGELRITDRIHFRETLKSGVGSGKAYGFGLLSVAPTRSLSRIM